jgi:hypothetical protein
MAVGAAPLTEYPLARPPTADERPAMVALTFLDDPRAFLARADGRLRPDPVVGAVVATYARESVEISRLVLDVGDVPCLFIDQGNPHVRRDLPDAGLPSGGRHGQPAHPLSRPHHTPSPTGGAA